PGRCLARATASAVPSTAAPASAPAIAAARPRCAARAAPATAPSAPANPACCTRSEVTRGTYRLCAPIKLRRMWVTSLGFQTDVALRVLEGAETADRGDYLVVRTPVNPDFYWGNFLLLRTWPEAGSADRWLTRFAAEFPAARHVA